MEELLKENSRRACDYSFYVEVISVEDVLPILTKFLRDQEKNKCTWCGEKVDEDLRTVKEHELCEECYDKLHTK